MQHVPVLIAGGGPVGMTLALVLARLGVRAMLVERNVETTRHPKMDITNVRSMELFRRLGLAQSLRAVAVPESHPFDVAWVTTMAGVVRIGQVALAELVTGAPQILEARAVKVSVAAQLVGAR